MSARRQISRLLEREFDGTLDAAGRFQLEELRRRDASVARLCARQERLLGALEALEDPRLDAFDADRFMEQVDRRIDAGPAHERRTRRTPLWLGVVAACAAAALAVRVGLFNAEPVDEEPLVQSQSPERGGAVSDGVRETAHETAQGVASNSAVEPTVAPPVSAGPAFELAARAPTIDPEQLAAALEVVAHVLAAAELPHSPGTHDVRGWRDGLRAQLTGGELAGWSTSALVERRIETTDDEHELKVAVAYRLVGHDTVVLRRVARVLRGETLRSFEPRAPEGTGGSALAPAERRRAWCAAVLAVGTTDFVADLVASGALGASDLQPVVERLLSDSLLATSLARRDLDGADAVLLAQLVRTDERLVAPLVDRALAPNAPPGVVAALRGSPRAESELVERLSLARSAREQRRALELVGELGAAEALDAVRTACRAGEPAAFDALRLLPGEDALLAWLELSVRLAPAPRLAGWFAIAERRGDELPALVRTLELGDARLVGLADALMATGSSGAAAALYEIAARPDSPSLVRARCIDAASRSLRTDRGRDDVLHALERAANSAPDDLVVQEACLVAVHEHFGHDRARAWCEERWQDDSALAVLAKDFDAEGPRAALVRARLRLYLERTLAKRTRA